MRRAPAAEPPAPPEGPITAIVPSARAPGRFTLMIAGASGPTLGLEAIERLGLAVGGSTVGRGAELAAEVTALRVYDRAVAMLTARGRAARELERQLVRKGEPPEAVRAAIERLRAEGFVNDEEFARHFVRSRAAGAGLAKRRLQQELGRRGVERAVADQAVDEVMSEEEIDEEEAAVALAARRLRTLTGLDPDARHRRLYGFLARRGYSPDTIAKALKRASGGESISDSGAEEPHS